MDNQQDLLYSTWNSAQSYVAVWMGWELGEEWILVYVWLSPFILFFFFFYFLFFIFFICSEFCHTLE